MKKNPNLPPHCLVRILLAASLTLCFTACKDNSKSVSPPPAMVEVAAVIQADMPVYHEWIGTLDGLVNAQIRAQVTGYLLTQTYREGDTVKKGDLLFEIDPRPFKATLDAAKGQLAQAVARLGKTELDVKRYAPLVKDKAISQEEYDDAVQANLEAKAAVVSAQAQVEQAQINLDFTRIVSPIDGIASIAKAQIGDLVGPGTGELASVSTLDPIKAYFNVTEQAYINFTKLFSDETLRNERVRQLELQLLLADGTIYPHEGRIYSPDLKIGPTTGALRIEARFPNPGNALRPGEFARIRVKFDTKHDALLVPQRAVSELQGSYQVAVVDTENKIHIQPVRVGERSGNLWTIEEGLHSGQRVVVEGVQKIREGAAITPTNYVAEIPAPPAASPKSN
ncbi:MAG TPA: efflux RND transporter periplasmic adaptor subunit [Verrucomicrobiae bacterium]|nr:efflux RND transporter periplasmic adaptor subunit [Verrucomicrobiae bacterium]